MVAGAYLGTEELELFAEFLGPDYDVEVLHAGREEPGYTKHT